MTRVRYVGASDAGGRAKRSGVDERKRPPVSRLVFGLAVLGLCGLAVLVSMRCELDEIRIQGAHLVDLGAVRQSLESNLGTPLLLVDCDEVRDLFRDDPWVESLSVHRRLPGTMWVVVRPAQPCLRLGDGRAVSSKGEILPSRDDVDLSPLPLVSATAEQLARAEHDGGLALFCRALTEVPWPFADPLVEVAMAGGDWLLRDGAGIRYALGQDDFSRRLRRLSIARERFAAREGDCVDLRFDRQIVLIPAMAGSLGG